MAVLDHLGITIDDLARSTEQFGAIFEALGYERLVADGSVSWQLGDEPELILMPVRDPASAAACSTRHAALGSWHGEPGTGDAAARRGHATDAGLVGRRCHS